MVLRQTGAREATEEPTTTEEPPTTTEEPPTTTEEAAGGDTADTERPTEEAEGLLE